MAQSRSEVRNYYQAIEKEIGSRTEKRKGSPLSGAGKVGKGKGTKRQWQFREWDDQSLHDELAKVGQRMDEFTYRPQEGKLTSGKMLERPFQTLPMFVGVLCTVFENDWIKKAGCYVCWMPFDIARLRSIAVTAIITSPPFAPAFRAGSAFARAEP